MIDDSTVEYIEEHVVDGNGYIIRHHSTHNNFREHIIVGEPTPAQWGIYANSDNNTLRFLAAEHPGTTTTNLERLALHDKSQYVRAAATLNPSTPDDVKAARETIRQHPSGVITRIATSTVKKSDTVSIQLCIQSEERRINT